MNDYAVIFDMDGVIADSNPYHKESITLFCERHGLFLSEEEFKERISGRANEDWISALFDNQLNMEEIRNYEKEKEGLYRELHGPHLVPLNGLIHFLEVLKQEGISMAVATAAPPENSEFVLGHLGILSYFKTVLNSSHVTNGKPDPEVYLKAAEKLGFLPERCLVFEDSLPGISAAQAAGTKVVGVCTTHSPEELSMTKATIDSFEEVELDFIQQIFAKK